MLNHTKSLSGALTVPCLGSVYLAFNSPLHPSPGISFPDISCSKVVPRCLHCRKPGYNCCGSWQQESSVGEQTFWRKVEEAHRNWEDAIPGLCVAERDCGFCMILFLCFCYSYDFLCQTKYEEKREYFEARSLVRKYFRTSGRCFPCLGGYEAPSQTQEAEICPTLRRQEQSSIQFLRCRIWLQVPAHGKLEPSKVPFRDLSFAFLFPKVFDFLSWCFDSQPDLRSVQDNAKAATCSRAITVWSATCFQVKHQNVHDKVPVTSFLQ